MGNFFRSKVVRLGMGIFNVILLGLLIVQGFVNRFANDTGVFVMFLASILCAAYVIFVYATVDEDAEDRAEGEGIHGVSKTLRKNGRGNMATFNFGKGITTKGDLVGRNIVINGKRIMVDGKLITDEAEGVVELRIIEGTVENITSDASVTVEGNVAGDVSAKMSVTCGDVAGNAKAGMSLTARYISGKATAGMSRNARVVGEK